MSLSTLEAVFSDVDSQTTLTIYAEVSANAMRLYARPTDLMLASIIKNIDEVSNGSGLQIVTLLMWPDDEIPEELKSLPNKILSNLAAVNAEMEITLAQKNLSIVESFIQNGEMAERFNELEYVDVDRTSDDLTGITFMDGSGLLIDFQLETVEIV